MFTYLHCILLKGEMGVPLIVKSSSHISSRSNYLNIARFKFCSVRKTNLRIFAVVNFNRWKSKSVESVCR